MTDYILLVVAIVLAVGKNLISKIGKNEFKGLDRLMSANMLAAITAMGLSWKAGIAAEVICSPKNTIGAGISDAKVYLESPQLFAWTITVIVMSVILEKILGCILGKRGKRV